MTTQMPVPVSTTVTDLPGDLWQIDLNDIRPPDQLPVAQLPVTQPTDDRAVQLATKLYNDVFVPYITNSHNSPHFNHFRSFNYIDNHHPKLIAFISAKFAELNPTTFALEDFIILEALKFIGLE